ncbi:unnamed protein product [Oppiella nova]|uniref:Uncharacterized protein n=1 Tax=Oppiella nova TaxID=334625 RepID=A0A7R9M3W7_9ACAR|nr:unnamed protein product [Oppiella nova]CAG2170296.1 unnamed protein product [Oppiella nova]
MFLNCLKSTATYESDSVSCNAFSYVSKNSTYTSKKDNKTIEITVQLNTYTVTLNGNAIFMLNGMIQSGPCAGGHLDELTFSVADDQNGCLSQKGLAQSTPVYSILRISGGKCESDCSGGVTTMYSPPIINHSDDISFKAC